MTLRVHIADRPATASGRARSRCGLWTRLYTTDPAAVTCHRCLTAKPPDLARKITDSQDPPPTS